MKLKLSLGTVAGLALASLAQGQAISLVNPSFELPGTGKISTGFSTITGWNAFGGALTASDSGVEKDGSGFGTFNAYFNAADAQNGIEAAQTTSYGLLGTESLQLTFAAEGSYGSEGPGGNYGPLIDPMQLEAQLYYVSAGSQVVFATDLITFNTQGSWANYTFNVAAPSAGAGDYLGVDIYNATTDPAHFNWVESDNVGLSVVPVPEPGTMALVGLGAGGLLTLRRRRS